jgi:MFS family permease
MTEAVAVGRAEVTRSAGGPSPLSARRISVILDVSIVNVALPSIQQDLHFSQGDLRVLSAYALTFGGFLCSAGARPTCSGAGVFMVGVALFTAASLACGLSNSEGMLIAARAVQGLGAAIFPAALSIISTTFAEGSERNKALGIWGAMGGSGAAVGVLMGGVLTKWLGWSGSSSSTSRSASPSSCSSVRSCARAGPSMRFAS